MRRPAIEAVHSYPAASEFIEHVRENLIRCIDRDFPLAQSSEDDESAAAAVNSDPSAASQVEAAKERAKQLEDTFREHVAFAKAKSNDEVHEELIEAIDDYVTSEGALVDSPSPSSTIRKRRQSAEAAAAAAAAAPKAAARYNKPLLIAGEAGTGKTTVLSRWLAELAMPEAFVLPHFVGCCGSSFDHVSLVRRLLLELQRAFRFDGELADSSEQMLEQLAPWLRRAANRRGTGTIIIVIDGLDALRDEAAAHKLEWLPAQLPDGVKLIVSTTVNSASYKALRSNDFKLGVRDMIEVPERIELDEKQSLIGQCLKPVGKTLDKKVEEPLTGAEQTDNAMFLRIAMDFLLDHAKWATLGTKVGLLTRGLPLTFSSARAHAEAPPRPHHAGRSRSRAPTALTPP
jgi:hypothetical protein